MNEYVFYIKTYLLRKKHFLTKIKRVVDIFSYNRELLQIMSRQKYYNHCSISNVTRFVI